jgi:hypothetical protein
MSGTEDDTLRRLIADGRDQFIRERLTRLAAGGQDREAAIGLLEEFRSSATPHRALYFWLWDAFGRVIAGEDANAALGLKLPASRPRATGAIDPVAIACFVELQLRNGMKLPAAKREAADYFSRDARTIANACRTVRLNPGLDSGLLQHLAVAGRRPKKPKKSR